MRPTLHNFEESFTRDYASVALLLSALIAVLAVAFHNSTVVACACVLFFAAFDSMLFYNVHRRGGKEQHDEHLQALMDYRIVQATVQHGIGVLIALMAWQAALLYYALWWCGVCDMLYYVMLEQTMDDTQQMWWVDWTMQGVVYKLLYKKSINYKAMKITTVIAGIACLTVYFILN